jgi:hypothetical protein
VIILSTAIDPFSQQILQYYDCLRPTDRGPQALMPITQYYSAGSYYTNGDSKIPDGNMTAALYLGLVRCPMPTAFHRRLLLPGHPVCSSHTASLFLISRSLLQRICHQLSLQLAQPEIAPFLET